MSFTTFVVSHTLSVLLAVASAPKILGEASATKNAEHPGVSVGLYLFVVGAGEGLGVVGFVIGLFWWPMELVAASGVVLLMIGVVGAHRRAGESMSDLMRTR